MAAQLNHSAVTAPAAKQWVPGYLLAPFGWAAEPLAAMVQADPGLLTHVFKLDRSRMHTIALALAHLDGAASRQLGPVLLSAPTREILHHILGHPPAGIKRALRRLPAEVLTRQSYRLLVQLLDHPQTAKLLHHFGEPEITDAAIQVLDEVSPPLRSVALAVLRFVCRLDNLPAGLRFLAGRGAAPSFDALVTDLAARPQPAQFIARLKQLVAALPLPQIMPPAQIGPARRLDAAQEICALAKRFKNCLAMYTGQVDAGECAIYFWDDPATPAACQVRRHGRLGWFLSQALGPQNVEPKPQQLQHIRHAFAEAGIPQYSVICAIERILQLDGGAT